MAEHEKSNSGQGRVMPKRDDAHMDRRRNQIIDGLLASVRKKGLASTSTQDVAAACGLSVGSMYVHFKSKEEILHAAIRRSSQRLESGEFYDQFGDPRDFLKVMERLLRYFDHLANDPIHGADLEIMLMARHDPVLRKEIEINQKARFDFIRGCAALLPGAHQLQKRDLDVFAVTVAALMADADQRALAGTDVQRPLKMAAIRQLVRNLLPAQFSAKSAA
jgi:AcrR family transcriptional regulator